MKKFIFIFSFLIGSMSMFANEVITDQGAADALFEIDIPLEINAPDEVYNLLSIVTADEPLGLLQDLASLLDKLLGVFLPDVIELEVLGIPGGITIFNAGLDISLWDVQISEALFNIIAGEEGATAAIELMIIPGILSVNLTISLT